MSSPIQPSVGSRPIVFTEIEQFGGAERSVLGLVRFLQERGLPVHIVTYEDRASIERYISHRLPVVQLKPQMRVRSKVASLKQYFLEHPSPKPLLSGYQPALHASLAGMKGFHCLMHDTPALFNDGSSRSLKNRFRIAASNRIIGHGLRSGGATIVTSEFLQADCKRDFNVRAHIVRMGGMPEQHASRLRPVENQLRLFSVSRIEANKRIDWLIRALATLEKNGTPLSSRIDWRLDLAGKGSQIDVLKQLATSLGIADRVHFLGFVPDDQLEQLYEQAHLFLMPAIQGYGIPAIESLQRGIPILIHRESGVSDILLNTPWATVFSGGENNLNPALQHAIESVIAGTQLAVSPPSLPTEDEWAEEVASLCGWL